MIFGKCILIVNMIIFACATYALGLERRVQLRPKLTFGNLAYGMQDGGREKSLDGYEAVVVDPDFDAEIIKKLKRNRQIVMCYLSVGTLESYRPFYADGTSKVVKMWNSLTVGRLTNFYEERYLDLRKMKTILPLMRIRMKELKEKGCDVVAPDNMDCYQAKACAGQWRRRSRQWKYKRSASYALALADMAHDLGMAIVIKNSLELYAFPGIFEAFDGASVESCVLYNECDVLSIWDILQKPVFGTEYRNYRSCKRGGFPDNVMMKYCPGNRGRWLCKKHVKTWENCFQRYQGRLPEIEYTMSALKVPLERVGESNDVRLEFADRLNEIVELQNRANDTVLHTLNPKERSSVWERIQDPPSN